MPHFLHCSVALWGWVKILHHLWNEPVGGATLWTAVSVQTVKDWAAPMVGLPEGLPLCLIH